MQETKRSLEQMKQQFQDVSKLGADYQALMTKIENEISKA